jgi:hypothetical protein
MIPAGDLGQRLRTFIKTTAYKVVLPPAKVTVIEPEKSGEADVECTIPEGCVCIDWTTSQDMFNFLEGKNKADGAFVIHRADGKFEAHIVECKKTVDSSKWGVTTQQMRCTLSRLLAIAGTLGLSFSRVVLYTAFQTDNLSSDESRNFATAKRTIVALPQQSEVEADLDWAGRQQLAWEKDQVYLRGFEGIFPHKKIKLNQEGLGAVVFDGA